VAESLVCNLPRLIPAEPFKVYKYAHQLGNSERRMRVVELNCGLFGKPVECLEALLLIIHFVSLLVAADDILERGRCEEKLLLEPQFLSFKYVVVRIENLRDVL